MLFIDIWGSSITVLHIVYRFTTANDDLIEGGVPSIWIFFFRSFCESRILLRILIGWSFRQDSVRDAGCAGANHGSDERS